MTSPEPGGMGGLEESYYAYYLGNAMLNVLLAVCVFLVYRADRK